MMEISDMAQDSFKQILALLCNAFPLYDTNNYKVRTNYVTYIQQS